MVLGSIWPQASRVLPIICALQGHSKSGKLWEKYINSILIGPKLNFKHTTHDQTILKTTFKGHKVLLLHQVYNMMIQTDDEDIAKEIFMIIGLKLQLENEVELPFTYLGRTIDFNGVDIDQSRSHIIISCENFID